MTIRLTPILIFVKNFDECLEFYQRVFGLKPEKMYRGSEHPPYVEFQVGDVRLALHGGYDGPPHKQEPLSIHFDVEDVNETVERVKQYGGQVKRFPRKLDFSKFAELQIVCDATIIDPDGNELELRQVLEEF